MLNLKGRTDREISDDLIKKVDAYWRAANYLGAAQIYLQDNALLERKLKPEDIKPRLLGHWGTQPGINYVYAHLNRLIIDTKANVLLVTGPGHGAPANLANLYLEGTLEDFNPELSFSKEGMSLLCKQFSWPEGAPSHLVPSTPGTIQEGGELGYCLMHAYGAVLDNPDLIAACIIGDGEAETGPLWASWTCNRFINPKTSGTVLPILHLNGYKLSGPTILSRMSDEELEQLFSGLGYGVCIVSGSDPLEMHRDGIEAFDWAYGEIQKVKESNEGVPRFPMIILRTPKGWTCPKEIDEHPVEGTSRAHQIPVPDPKHNPEHLFQLERWLESYKPEELFDDSGFPLKTILDMCPKGDLRMGKNVHVNGGNLLEPLRLPPPEEYEVKVKTPGVEVSKPTAVLGKWVRDVMEMNATNFRFFCPDETTSNRMDAIFDVTSRAWMSPILPVDQHMSQDGRVIEILSEHVCEGLLEGYLVTGRHGLFACYEAFIPIVDSMLNQYAKWLKVSRETEWRRPIASLNYILTSHVWRQDHNGYSHQVPTFMNNLANKKSSVARIYLPPDTNCLLSMAQHCLLSRDYINLIVASKQEYRQWLTMEQAKEHCKQGVSIWDWASNDGGDPDVILCAAGDVPTTETIAAASLLRNAAPNLKVRVVNVVDLFSLIAPEDHPHGLKEELFEQIFTKSTPVVFAFHGYPRLIHELLHHRPNPARFHVRGYIEEGTTTTPFDMLMLNQMSRYHLASEAIRRCPDHDQKPIQEFESKMKECKEYLLEHGEDIPEVTEWKWE